MLTFPVSGQVGRKCQKETQTIIEGLNDNEKSQFRQDYRHFSESIAQNKGFQCFISYP